MGENGEFSEADFEACFKEFDKDGNGTISKDEMKIFIKKVAGLWTKAPSPAARIMEEVAAHTPCSTAARIVWSYFQLLISSYPFLTDLWVSLFIYFYFSPSYIRMSLLSQPMPHYRPSLFNKNWVLSSVISIFIIY